MIKTGMDVILKPLQWERKRYDKVLVAKALNVQLDKGTFVYYKIVTENSTGISYLSTLIESYGEDVYQSPTIESSLDVKKLVEIAEKNRVKNLDSLVKHTLSTADISKTLMPPLEWRDVEVSTRYGTKGTIYAKILGFSKDGELYFQISQGHDGKFYLELKACMDSEDTVKGYLYSSYDVEELKKFAKEYRMNQIAKTLLN